MEPKTSKPIDIHDLARLPYGKAKEALIKGGHWDEFLGKGEPKPYYAEATGTVKFTASLKVMARCKAEAEKLVDAADHYEWHFDYDDHLADWEEITINEKQ